MVENKGKEFVEIFAKKIKCANEILQHSSKMLELMKTLKTDEAFGLLDLRQTLFESMQKLDEKIVDALSKSDSKSAGRIKRILSLNEPENLGPFEEKLLHETKTFVEIMGKVADINEDLQAEFKNEQNKIIKELSDLGEQRRKLLHSKKFAETMLAGKEKQNWDVKL